MYEKLRRGKNLDATTEIFPGICIKHESSSARKMSSFLLPKTMGVCILQGVVVPSAAGGHKSVSSIRMLSYLFPSLPWLVIMKRVVESWYLFHWLGASRVCLLLKDQCRFCDYKMVSTETTCDIRRGSRHRGAANPGPIMVKTHRSATLGGHSRAEEPASCLW